MKIEINMIPEEDEEMAILRVHCVDQILYLESVDRKVFVYTDKETLEVPERLYVLEERLSAASIPRQIAYLLAVWLIFISCSLLSGWGAGPKAAVSILAEALIIYFAIRLVNYQLVKMEVKQMNRRLERTEENETKTLD